MICCTDSILLIDCMHDCNIACLHVTTVSLYAPSQVNKKHSALKIEIDDMRLNHLQGGRRG